MSNEEGAVRGRRAACEVESKEVFMRTSVWALTMVLGLAGAAAAQDGGKLDWKGKGKEDPKAAMAEAKRHGKAMMLFFTSEG